AGVSAVFFAWAGGVAAGLLALGLVVALVVSRASARRVDPGTEESLVSDHDCCAPEEAAGATEGKEPARQAPFVEGLGFDGCPNHEPPLALVGRVGPDVGVAAA